MGIDKELVEEMREDIVQLQILVTHQEQFIESLNEVVRSQQEQIDQLSKALDQLREMSSMRPEGEVFNLEEEKPPHY